MSNSTRTFDLNSACDDVYTGPHSGLGLKPSGYGAAADGRRLTDERLARHDEEEEAKRLAMPASDAVDADAAGGISAAGGAMLTAESETAAAAAALAAARGGSSLAQRTAVGGWPGVGVGPAAAAAVAQTSGVNAAVAGYLGWPPSDRLIGAATAGAGAAAEAVAAAEAADRRAMAARGLLAIPSSGHGDDVVDLTGGVGGRSLAEQDEEQMQLAIAMSLSAAEVGGGAGGGSSGGVAPGDDTETEEDVEYGAQLSGTDADTTDRGGSPQRKRTEADSSGSESGSSGRAQGGRGSRGLAEAVGGERNDGSRRIRRRRDESGASTSGEQSPSGTDGGTAGGAEMELDESGVAPPPPSSALAPLNAAAHSNVSSFRRAGSLVASDSTGRSSGEGCASAAGAGAGAGAGGLRDTGSPANVCVAAATGGGDENDSGAAAPVRLPSRAPSPCPSSSSSCSFSLEPGGDRRRAARRENRAAAAAAAAESTGHGDPNSATAVPMSQKEHGEMNTYHRQPATQASPQGQSQLQVSIPGDEGGMIGVLGGVIPTPATASSAAGVTGTAGLGTGGGGGGDLGHGGGFVSDDLAANDMLLRDFGVAPGALDDKLLTVAGWHGDVSYSPVVVGRVSQFLVGRRPSEKRTMCSSVFLGNGSGLISGFCFCGTVCTMIDV